AGRWMVLQPLIALNALVVVVAVLALLIGELDAVQPAVARVQHVEVIGIAVGEGDAVRRVGTGAIDEAGNELLILRQRCACREGPGDAGGRGDHHQTPESHRDPPGMLRLYACDRVSYCLATQYRGRGKRANTVTVSGFGKSPGRSAAAGIRHLSGRADRLDRNRPLPPPGFDGGSVRARLKLPMIPVDRRPGQDGGGPAWMRRRRWRCATGWQRSWSAAALAALPRRWRWRGTAAMSMSSRNRRNSARSAPGCSSPPTPRRCSTASVSCRRSPITRCSRAASSGWTRLPVSPSPRSISAMPSA